MDPKEKLIDLLGDSFGRYFNNATFTKEGVSFPTRFQADWAENNCNKELYLAFGKRPEIAVEEKVKKKQAEIIQLDFWEDGKRAAANAVLRSALFPALGRQKRHFMKEVMLDAVDGITIFFTGEQFDQSDFDVYLEILNFARPFPLGKPVRFSAHGMLKMLGKTTGGTMHKWLHSVLIRLRSGTVDMTDHKKRFFGGLIEGGFKDELTETYEVTINPKFAVLFGFGMWSTIDITQRRALGGSGSTAKALHAYYSTHAAPSLHTFETLAKIVGLRGTTKRNVRARLIKAHDELKAVGFLKDFVVLETGIKVHKTHTPAQEKHLAKAAQKATVKRSKKGAA